MKVAIALIVLVLTWTGPGKISQINAVKSEAKKAFNDGNYKDAVKKYRYLVDSLGVTEDEVMLNLAHAYYLSNDTTNARTNYEGLTQSSKNVIRSKALQQLGLLNNKRGKSEEALNQFKQAIKADPGNQDARYNYEMLKKKLEDKKKQDQQNKNDKNKNEKDQEPSDFAKKLKEQADKLVAERKYSDAYNLMADGLKKDKTVSTYQEYINRTKIVGQIYK